MKAITLKQTGITVKGIATLHFWGGGEGTIEMQSTFLPIGKVTKDNILRCVNDNGFGCEAIISAEIEIYDQYEGNYQEFNRTIIAEHPIHSKLFLGWRELKEQGIKC
jgi:hypothetical protein